MAGEGVYTELRELVLLRHAARGYSFLPRQPITSILAGNLASRLRGRGLDFEELRAYRPGDDTRSMDWRATARLRKPQVRVYQEERDRPALFLVDQRRGMFFGSRVAMKSVVAAQAAALGAWRALDQDDRVGGIVFGDGEASFVRPRRSAATVLELLQRVVQHNHALEADGGPDDPGALNRALERAARTARHDHLVVLVSDFHGFDDASERWVTRLAAHNDVLAVLVSDPFGRDLPDAGPLSFARGAERVQVDTSRREARERFRARFDELVEGARARLRRLDVPLLQLTPERPVLEQLHEALGSAR